IVLLACEAALQASVLARFSVCGAAPQLVLLSVLAWSLARGPVEGMVWGFAGGLLLDLASGGPVGVSALAMVPVAGITGSFGGRLFSTNPLLPMVAVFGATLTWFVLASFLLATLHYPTDWGGALLDVAVPTAIANAVLSLIVYP